MSGSEMFCLVICFIPTALWLWWFYLTLCFVDFDRNIPARISAIIVPALAMLGLFVVLCTATPDDVRNSNLYIFFYLVMGIAWLQLIVGVSACMGFILRDDWIERGNPAAAICGSGLLLGGMAAFAGGNIGDGPGWWVVVLSAGLSTGTILIGLAFINLTAGVLERITVGREVSLAVRMWAFLVTTGVISGFAVAGDWVSAGATVTDFVITCLPLFGLIVFLGFFEMLCKNSRLPLSVSVLFAAGELSCAACYLVWVRMW